MLRPDLQIIADLIAPRSSVLDIGCNNGELLYWLQEHKQAKGRGLEINQCNVRECLAKGLSVIQGDANVDLAYYPDQSVDYIVLSRTLQALQNPDEVLHQLVRIGKRAILSVPNFGHWSNRIYLLLKGRMPVTRELSYQWYDTPNIHFCTIRDFIKLCEKSGYTIEKQLYISSHDKITLVNGKSWLANIIGKQGVFVVHR